MTDSTVVADEVTPEQHKRLRWALVLISLAQLMVVLDSTIANIALPFIGADLDIDQANLQWIVTGYALTFGGFLLLGGRLGRPLRPPADLHGRRAGLRTRLAHRRLRPERGHAAVGPGLPGPRRRASPPPPRSP